MTNRVPKYDFENDGTIDADVDNDNLSTKSAVATVRSIMPTYGDLDSAPQDEAGVVYITGTGGDTPGLYVWNADASAWDGPFTSNTNEYPSLSTSGGVQVPVAKDIAFVGENDTSVSVTDDGDDSGTVYVNTVDTNTQTDVSDGTGTVLSNVDDITFTGTGASNLSVGQDGSGGVNVEVGSTDTRTDVSDTEGALYSDVNDITLNGVNGADVSVTDDGSGGANVEISLSSTDETVDTRTDVSDSTGTVLQNTNDITFTASDSSAVSVVDDGDGTVTVDVSSTDTHTSVSDSTGEVLSDVDDIAFTDSGATNLTVTDDGDGSATVDIGSTNDATDTRTDLEDSTGVVVEDTQGIEFASQGAASVTVSDDGDGTGSVLVGAQDTDTDTHADVADGGGTVLSDVSSITFTAADDAGVSVTDNGSGDVGVEVSATDTDTDTHANVSQNGTVVQSDTERVNFTSSGVADVSVTSDGTGGADIEISVSDTDTDTHTDVSDASGKVLSDVDDIAFTASGASTMSVSDDGDGTATVQVSSSDTSTDTRTDVSEAGSQVQQDTTTIDFTSSGAADVSVGSDGSGGVGVDVSATDTDTQLSNEEVEDVVGALITGSGATSVSYDDANGVLTVSSTDTDTHIDVEADGSTVESDVPALDLGTNLSGGSNADGSVTIDATDTDTQLSDEEVQDIVAGVLAGSGSTTVSYDDANNVVTISSTNTDTHIDVQADGSTIDTDVSALDLGSNLSGTSNADGSVTIEGTDTDTQRTNEEIQDVVNTLLTGSGATTLSYDDANNVLTISSTDSDTQLSNEEVEDIVGSLITGGSGASVDYDDANGVLTVSATGSDTHIDVEENGSTLSSDIPALDLGSNVSGTVNADDSVTIDGTDTDTQRTDEEIQDVVDTLLTGSGATSVSYDDANNVLTISSTDSDTHIDVDEDGSAVGSDVPGLNLGSNLSGTQRSDFSVTLDATDTDTQLSGSEVRNKVDGNIIYPSEVGSSSNFTNSHYVQDLYSKHEPVANVKAWGATGDGVTNDYSAIQDAINYAETNGHTVYFPPGRYQVSTRLIADSQVAIKGDSWDAVTLLAGDTLKNILEVQGDGTTVRDIAIDGDFRTREGLRVEGDNSNVESVRVQAIASTSTYSNAASGILLANNKNSAVRNCRVEDVQNQQSYVSVGIGTKGTGEIRGDHRIIGNYVRDITPDADGDGIKVAAAHSGTVVANNRILDGEKRAIKAQAPNMVVTGNSCYWRDGSNGPRNAIAAQHDNIVIADNQISADAMEYEGIHQSSGYTGGTIEGNTIEIRGSSTSGDCIVVQCDGTAVTGNTVHMNGQGRYGIALKNNVSNVAVTGNVIDSPDTTGIRLWSDGGTTENVTIGDNVVMGAGTYGVDILSSNDVRVSNNRLDSGGAEVNDRNNDADIVGLDSGIVVYNSAGESISPTTPTTIDLGGTAQGWGGEPVTAGNDQVNISRRGTYDLSWQVMLYQPTNAMRWQARINLNGSNTILWPDKLSRGGSYDTMMGSLTREFSAGDDLSIAVWHDKNDSLSIESGATKTYLNVSLVEAGQPKR